MRRMIVARAPWWDAPRRELVFVPARVGVLPFSYPDPPPDFALDPALGAAVDYLAVVLRVAVPLGGGGGAPTSPEPPPFTVRDFVPYKPMADVLVTGKAPVGPLRVQIGGIAKTFEVIDGADLASGARDAQRRSARTKTEPDVGKVDADERRVVDGRWDDNQLATEALRLRWPLGGEPVTVTLADDRALTGNLPGREPFLRLVSRTEAPDRLVETRIDTVEVDVTEARLVVTYRGVGTMERADAGDVDRIDVVWWPASEPFVFALAEAEIPRSTFEHAWQLEDVEAGEAPPPLEGDDLTVARYETWDVEHGPLPVMTVERFATISAALAEQHEPRDRALERHGVSSYEWDVEERAWAQTLAEADIRNDGDDRKSLPEHYGELFVAAQDALARPEEAAWTEHDYARVTGWMEVQDPARSLVEQRMTLGEYQRLQRRMGRRVERDRAFGAELERLVAAARARAREERAARGEADFPADLEEEDDE